MAPRLDRRRGLERKSWLLLRLVSWAGALISLAGLALAAKLIMDWSTDHVLAVPLGLPESIALAGVRFFVNGFSGQLYFGTPIPKRK